MNIIPVETTHVMSFHLKTHGQAPRMVALAAVVWRVGSTEEDDIRYFSFSTDTETCLSMCSEFCDNIKKTESKETPRQMAGNRPAPPNHFAGSLVDVALELTVWARQWYKRTDGNIIVVTGTSGCDYQFISDMLASVKQLPTEITNENETTQLPLSLNYLFGKYKPVHEVKKFSSWIRDPHWLLEVDWDNDTHYLNEASEVAARAAFYLSLNAE